MSQPLTPGQKIDRLYKQAVKQYQGSHSSVRAWLMAHAPELHHAKQASQQMVAALSMAGTIAMQQPQLSGVALPENLQRGLALDSHILQLAQAESPKADAALLSQVTREEHEAIFAKMQQYSQAAPGHLPKEEELYLEQQLHDMLGFDVVAELDGNRLNHSVGIMGGEQHLKRFPTDTLNQHDAYLEAGMAPNRGAFGWFTDQGQLTEKAIQREKYYFAVQTLYLPNWAQEHPRLKEWYKFRKMIVINPADKKAVVGVVGDAGPALWVKKQFGGSPEVIKEGQIWSKSNRGRVLLLFVNDPEDKVPLGPIDLDWDKYQGTQSTLSLKP